MNRYTIRCHSNTSLVQSVRYRWKLNKRKTICVQFKHGQESKSNGRIKQLVYVFVFIATAVANATATDKIRWVNQNKIQQLFKLVICFFFHLKALHQHPRWFRHLRPMIWINRTEYILRCQQHHALINSAKRLT